MQPLQQPHPLQPLPRVFSPPQPVQPEPLSPTVQSRDRSATQDQTHLSTHQGRAAPVLNLPLETWTQKQKDAIVTGFRSGLHHYEISAQEITTLLRTHGISQLEINEETIQDPSHVLEIMNIQRALDARLNHPELRALGQANRVIVDGQFGKNSVAAMAALRTSDRGPAITLPVTPIRQQSRTGCYRTAEAMLFNLLHGKDGTADAYTEFDARERIHAQDMAKQDMYVAQKENAQGRITVSRTAAVRMLDHMDAELEAGRPLIAGVSYRKQEGVEFNEGITDHFVLISGRGQDEAGTFYLFQDPAGGGTHKLRLDPVTGRLSGRGDMVGIYDVTLVQSATVTDANTLDAYRRTGRILFSQGQSRAELGDLQRMLTAMGFDTKGTTGAYGQGTTAAVRAFQEQHQLPVKGSHIDTHTRDVILAAFRTHQLSHPNQVMFRRGDISPTLSALQKALTRLGFNTQGSKGQFGPATEAAVKAFQTRFNLPVSGKIDNQTWLKILEHAQF